MYSYADASRLIGSTPREVRRWMSGYQYKSTDGQAAFSEPLWTSQLAQYEDHPEGIGFRDLLELRFVRKFRDAGVPLQLIRQTLEAARDLLSTPYPFTCKKFQTDGRRIFLSVAEESGDPSLIDLAKKQNVIEPVIGPSLRTGIEFDADSAARWFPLPKSKAVVLDPQRSFGHPVLTDSGVPTAAVAAAVRAEKGDESFVARVFDIPKSAVKRAVEFEARMAGRESVS